MSYSNSNKSLAQLDLNLLITLHALLETHSTTQAAEKINRTQSAVSIALGRLRHLFGDPLFIRHGPKLTPTDFALQLKAPLSRLVYDAGVLIASRSHFDPQNSDQEITLAIPDIASAHISTIVNGIKQDAPKIKVALADSSIKITDYSEGIALLLNGKIDLLMSFYVDDAPQGIHVEPLEQQTWSVFARQKHPIASEPSLEEWASYGHILIESGAEGRSPITDALANHRIKRNITLKVNSFLQALHIVADSDMLLTTMTPLASPIAKRLNLREVILPLDVPPVPFCILTRSIEHDPLSAWLTQQALRYLNK